MLLITINLNVLEPSRLYHSHKYFIFHTLIDTYKYRTPELIWTLLIYIDNVTNRKSTYNSDTVSEPDVKLWAPQLTVFRDEFYF